VTADCDGYIVFPNPARSRAGVVLPGTIQRACGVMTENGDGGAACLINRHGEITLRQP